MRYELVDGKNGAILATSDKRSAVLDAASDFTGDLRLVKIDADGVRSEDTAGTKQLAKDGE